MCGIAGEWGWSGRPREQSPIAAMIQSIAHRGPEGQACWFNSDGAVALAYAQLSFFKAANVQPVHNTRSSVFVVCNGEIYNYQELAGLVRQAGRNIAPGSDVEIIPHLYELRGPSSFFETDSASSRSITITRQTASHSAPKSKQFLPILALQGNWTTRLLQPSCSGSLCPAAPVFPIFAR